jgi:uncharacterized membrane protein YfcA
MNEIWLALPTGIGIATVASAVGIGGGILWMPFLIIMLRMKPETAVLTSLIIQSAGMGSGAAAYSRKDRIDYRLAGLLLLITAPGIALGAYAARMTSPAHMELILGLLTLTTAFLFVSANQQYHDVGEMRARPREAKPYLGFISLLSIVSGLLSVSIGEWLIPIMRSKMALRMSAAVATSITTIFGTCLVGAASHAILGNRPQWAVILWAVPGVLIGGQIGPRLAEHINERKLKDMFIFLLTLIGIHLIYNAF